jgi:ABC-type branched-subunit amino acid transport system ATPase component
MAEEAVVSAYLGRLMLEVSDLEVSYGAAPALWGVSLEVQPGRTGSAWWAPTAPARQR